MANKPNDIIKNAKKMINDGYVYVYGYKGDIVTKSGIETLAKQYPSVFTWGIKSLALSKVGKHGIDCSGFVNKAAGTNLGGSTQICNAAPEKWSVKDISHVKNGMFIWRSGHIGLIEVDSSGQKWILEAQSTATDLKRTKWDSRAKSFTYYGKISGVNYGVEKTENKTNVSTTVPQANGYSLEDFVKECQTIMGVTVDGIAGNITLSHTVTISNIINRKHALVKPIQKRLNALGYNCGEVDGIAGNKFKEAITKYQSEHSCIADGEITAQKTTWKNLLGMIK